MSISEQVKELRETANRLAIGYNITISAGVKQFMSAADTIEALSAKLANMERSEDCGGWILFNEKLPKEGQKVLVYKSGKIFEDLFKFEFPEEWQKEDDAELIGFLYGEVTGGFAVLKNKKVYWQPLPQPPWKI